MRDVSIHIQKIINCLVNFRNYKKIQFLKAGKYMKTIVRKNYLDRIIELNGTPDIQIITGIRCSGKAKLMQAYMEYQRLYMWQLLNYYLHSQSSFHQAILHHLDYLPN